MVCHSDASRFIGPKCTARQAPFPLTQNSPPKRDAKSAMNWAITAVLSNIFPITTRSMQSSLSSPYAMSQDTTVDGTSPSLMAIIPSVVANQLTPEGLKELAEAFSTFEKNIRSLTAQKICKDGSVWDQSANATRYLAPPGVSKNLLLEAPNLLSAGRTLIGDVADLGEVDLSDEEREALEVFRDTLDRASV